MIDYAKLRLALKHLDLQLQNYNALEARPELTPIDREAVAESVIHRFETCYDCLWKILRRYMSEHLSTPELPASPKPLFRLAAQNHLFSSSIEQWLRYAEARIATTHDYSGEKAMQTLGLIPDFLTDALELYQRMTGEPWP